ncbi:hypothetical protein ACG7TL_009099 [Trametes sanguinea]
MSSYTLLPHTEFDEKRDALPHTSSRTSDDGGSKSPAAGVFAHCWAATVALLFFTNVLTLCVAAWEMKSLIHDLAARLEAVDTRDLPRPDPLYGLMK